MSELPGRRVQVPVEPRRPADVVLEGTHVRLEPLRRDHVEALLPLALEPELWELSPEPLRSRDDLAAYVDTALADKAAGRALPFAIVDRATGAAIGSTRYGNLAPEHRRLEIGWTWLGKRYWRTPRNTEAKLLLLRHAFDALGCLRVELKTDVLNHRSRSAILRLGAREEGVFRQHVVCCDGRLRDTVWFSILDTEWPEVRANLERRLRPG